MPNSIHTKGLWFDPRSLEKLADGGAWSRGLMLYRSQKALSLDIEPAGDHWVLMGEVQGTRREPYEVSIDMALTPVQAGMLLLTFLAVMNNLHDGETNAIEGISHFALFAAFIALVMMGLI